MISKHPLGITPTFEIDIGGVAVNYMSIDRVELAMNEGAHDLLVIRMKGIPPQAITEYIGSPVRMKLSRGTAEEQEFVGEIAQIMPESQLRGGAINRSPFQTADIYCMGASYKMRAQKSKNWGERTLVDIATQLAETYNFSLDVPVGAMYHSDTVQINKSDWEFLNEMCDTYGYGLNVHGTHMHIWDPWRATGRQTSYHVIRSLKAVGYDPKPQPGVIVNFSGVFSSHSATDRYATVLDAQGNITNVSSASIEDSSGLGLTYKTKVLKRIDAAAKSVEEAELAVKASIRNAIPFRATVDLVGVVGMYPGGIAKIEGYDSKFDGLWYIASVKQVLGGIGMTTTLELVLDSTNESSPTIYNTQRFKKPPEPQFLNGEWISTNRLINVYS